MLLDKKCAVMMRVMKKIYEKKIKEWNTDFGNRRLAVETCFIRNIYDDIVFLTKIPLKVKNERYFYLILRNCFEHVIIFRFLVEKSKTDPDIFNDYMGDNIDFDSVSNSEDEFEMLKKLGGKRTKKYKNKFFDMAKTFDNVESDTSLYKYYGILADDCHNSYYHNIEKIILKEKKCDRKDILMSILVLLTEFYQGFDDED